MNAFEIFEESEVKDQFEQAFDKLDKMEVVQLLSDLKYLPQKAFDDGIIDPPELSNAIKKFRTELKDAEKDFQMSNLYEVILSSEIIEEEKELPAQLTQREVHILKEITGLDQELVIHQVHEETTSLLSRVLLYRFRIYDLIDKTIFPHHKLSSKVIEALSNSTKELGYDQDWISFGNVLANQQELSKFCVTSPVLTKRVFGECIFITMTNDHGKEVIADLGSKIRKEHLFLESIASDRLRPLIERFINHNDRQKVKQHIELYLPLQPNIFMRRVLQVKLWMMGLYHGRLDDYFGPLSITALYDFLMTLVEESKNGKEELGRILFDLKNDQCMINIQYLLHQHFIPVENSEIPFQQGSIAQIFEFVIEDKKEISSFKKVQQTKVKKMSEQLTDSLKTELEQETNEILQESQSHIRQYKAKKGIAKFFSNIFKFVKNVFQKIKKLFEKLMGIVKKAAKVIFNEIREAFQNFKNGMEFLFGDRVIDPTTQITTDYDFDFDGITKIHATPSQEEIKLHTKTLKRYANALYPSLNFVKIVIQWGIRFASGPVGWVKILLGIAKLFKNMLRNKSVEMMGLEFQKVY